MKTLLTMMSVVLAVATAQATTVSSEKIQIAPSEVDRVIRLVDKKEIGSSHKKVSIVVADNGMSTDVSPRYRIYLGYASLAEMGNISTDFLISDQAYDFISAKRVSAGIYEVKAKVYSDEGFVTVTSTIDATKMFSDEKKMRENCEGFCDGELNTSVVVTEKVKKD